MDKDDVNRIITITLIISLIYFAKVFRKEKFSNLKIDIYIDWVLASKLRNEFKW